MKSPLPFFVALLCAGMTFASVALAEPPAPPASQAQSAAAALVDKQLLTPLKKAESKRSRFSRAAPVSVQRRVRVLDAVALTDARGRQFVRFAVDMRLTRGEQAAWNDDNIVGCVYPKEGAVYVREGESYFSARIMFGERSKERPDVCQGAPEGAVRMQSAAR